MACGRPVVASRTPGLHGYVRDGVDGREVPAGDPPALGAAIAELWEDSSEASRLGRAARTTVEDGRTIEHFVARVTQAIDALT
jgi:glycosyltransferase involved in cell wall biosynthesis